MMREQCYRAGKSTGKTNEIRQAVWPLSTPVTETGLQVLLLVPLITLTGVQSYPISANMI